MKLKVPEDCVYPKQCELIARGLEEDPLALIDSGAADEVESMLI